MTRSCDGILYTILEVFEEYVLHEKCTYVIIINERQDAFALRMENHLGNAILTQ